MKDFFKGTQSEELMEFSTALRQNPFGAELLRLSSEIYEDVDEAIEDLTAGLQNRGIDADEDDVYGYMTGEYLPTEEALAAFADLCEDEDGEIDTAAFNRLVASAQDAYDLAAEYAEQLEYEEEEDEDDEDYEDDDEVLVAEDPRVAELEEKLEDLATREDETEQLDSLVEYARDLQESGNLPPIAFSLLFGDSNTSSKSRYAEFSAQAAETDTPNQEHLDRIQYTLSVFDQCGPMMDFSSMAPANVEDSVFDKHEDYDAMATAEYFLNRD